jgi:hypothetical protein
MNRIITSIIFISLLSSCSTAYKSGQTPDDVYFSPAANVNEYVAMENNDSYNPENVPMNDRYLRMKIMSRSRWSAFDDDNTYWNDPHWNNRTYFNSYSNYNSPLYGGLFNYNPYSFYNPFTPAYYGQPYIVYNTVSKMAPRSTGPRMVNLNNYAPIKVSNYDPKSLNIQYNNAGGSYNNNSMPRGGYNPVNSNNGGSNPVRLFNNSSSNNSSNSSGGSSSSGSSSSSSSAPVRSFPRGGGGN